MEFIMKIHQPDEEKVEPIVPFPGQVITLEKGIEHKDTRLWIEGYTSKTTGIFDLSNIIAGVNKKNNTENRAYCTACKGYHNYDINSIETYTWTKCVLCGTRVLVSSVDQESSFNTLVEAKHYADTGIITYFIARCLPDFNKFGHFYYKDITLRLNVHPDGRLAAYYNKKFTRAYNSFSNVIGAINRKFNTNFSYAQMATYYNPRLKDLLSLLNTDTEWKKSEFLESWYTVFDINHRRRLYRQYDKIGSKAFAKVLPTRKSVKYLYLDYGRNLFNYKDLLRLYEILDHNKADRVIDFLIKHKNNIGILSDILIGLSFGFSIEKILNYMDKHGIIFGDTARMLEDILYYNTGYELPNINDIRGLHDQIMRDLSFYSNVNTKEIKLPVPKYPVYAKDGFEIVIPETAWDLKHCGDVLNICVGTYVKIVLKKQEEIYIVKEHGKIVGCISVVSNTIMQAKLKHNCFIATNDVIYNFVMEWAEINKIETKHTMDLRK